jgi:molybdenum cofactor guanylyltransferase
MELEAFVLIGGKSSRFGSDKALAEIGGVTLAERAANTISLALSPKNIYLVAADENQFPAKGLPKNLPVIYDQYKDRGPFGGLNAALSKTEAEWIFVLACDYPHVSIDLLKLLADRTDGIYDAIVPIQPDGRVQPLCAFYRAQTCRKAVEEILRTGVKLPPLRTVLEKIRTRYVQFDELKTLAGARDLFLNLNSPEDMGKVLPDQT